jgi:hypothetical protein
MHKNARAGNDVNQKVNLISESKVCFEERLYCSNIFPVTIEQISLEPTKNIGIQNPVFMKTNNGHHMFILDFEES